MNEQLPEQAKKLKKQYIRTFHNDGLLDFFIGWALVSAGIFLGTGLIIFSFLGWMPIPLILPLKKRFVIPRYGYVKFSRPTTIPLPILLGVGIVIVAGSLLFTFLSGSSGVYSPLALAVLGLGLLFSIGIGINRIALYGISIPLLFIIGLGSDLLTPEIVILIGVVLMLLGIYLFLNFIKKYPLEPEEENGNQ